MHGCSSTSVPVVNAEIDHMGGVVEGGVDIADRTSPRKAAIEKVQAELRKEYDVREKTNRELDFLLKGGDPLELDKLLGAASVSVHSTSLTDRHQPVVSEAKDSFAFTASPHGDSAESSGRPGAPPCEPNIADNLMLFDAEHEISEGNRNFLHASSSNIMPSEQSLPMDGSHKTRELDDSTAFGLPRKAYKRRYRSRPNRDGVRSNSTDINGTRSSQGISLTSRHGPRDVKGLASDEENHNISSSWNSNPTSATTCTLHKAVLTDCVNDMELDGLKSVESKEDLTRGVSTDAASDAIVSENPLDEQIDQQLPSSAAKTPLQMDSNGPEVMHTMEEGTSVIVECQPCVAAVKVENSCSPSLMNGLGGRKRDEIHDAHHISASSCTKGLEPESSCTLPSTSIDGNSESMMFNGNVESNGNVKNQVLLVDGTPVIESDKIVEELEHTEGIDSSTLPNYVIGSACQNHRENWSLQSEGKLNQSVPSLKVEVEDEVVTEGIQSCGQNGSESMAKSTDPLGGNPGPENETSCNVKHHDPVNISISDPPEAGNLTKDSTVSSEAPISAGTNLKLVTKADEDSILKEAQIIEVKRRRISELSSAASPKKIQWKSHWDYVLEEMTWLANDFAQERIWKKAAASLVSYQAAFASRFRKQEKSSGMDKKKVAHTLAKSVMEFWHSVQLQIQETGKELEQEHRKDWARSIRVYAARFLKHNKQYSFPNQAQLPLTPDRISDSGITDLSWDDNLMEENLFYTVPLGAMETYKKSIESHVVQHEITGSCAKEEVETSACDAAADFEDHSYDEDEGVTGVYNTSGAFEGIKSSRFGQKKQKHTTHAYGARSYEIGSDLFPVQCAENKIFTQQYALPAKRPGGSLNVSIPTKRVRTASRRVISAYNGGASGSTQLPSKIDASSGDTNSFQDDHSSLRGGLLVPTGLEVESVGDMEKQLPFDSTEVSTKPKMRKKAKHLHAAYEQRWQVDSSFQMEQYQRDNIKKRLETQQLESSDNSGFLAQPMIKKPKIMRQSQDCSFDNIRPSGGSVPSPVASQMSNMSNPNKIIKMLGGRDRGRKVKALKTPSAQPGSGSPWSLFEDQALVVLAHDMGPNWELVSDALNSTLHFKCIFRKAKDCKERHNFLMDRTSGDGADSAEDSGCSQSYPSTLPGIPKGSARQLFQRLQGPMEEDTLKSHFEKIIMIGQKQHYHKSQNDSQDSKQFQPAHISHANALAQVFPNNSSGGHILTPLDLCDSTIPSPDLAPLGYQGPHSSGVSSLNHGNVTPHAQGMGSSSALQGSQNAMVANNFSSSPGSLNSCARDGRYVASRTASLTADEQQRMQQYHQIIPGRNAPPPNISAPGALPGTDRGVRVLPGGNGVGMVCSVNRGLSVARPGFQGIASSSMLNPGTPGSPGMPSANMPSGGGGGPGSSMLKPREALQMVRPGLSQDPARQMMVPNIQMPGNSQGVPHFGGLSSSFPNHTAAPPVSSYPIHQPVSPQPTQVHSPHHPHFQGSGRNHAPNPQQQAYAIRLAKERQLQQRFLQQQQHQPQQQQQQFVASNSLMPHVKSQPQVPISSSMQNSSQVQPQTTSPLSPMTSGSSMNSMPQHQHKNPTPAQGVVRNAQAAGMGKQRQRQPQQLSQANRQHPHQRQQLQAQQQAKSVKGIGRGNLMMHQNIPIDPSLLNGVSTNPGNQCSEKVEPGIPLMQNPGLYTGSALNAVQPTRQHMATQSSNQLLPQQMMYSSQTASSSKHLQITDNNSQGHVQQVAPVLSSANQSVQSLGMTGSNHQHGSHQKLGNQNTLPLQRVVQAKRQMNSDPSTKPEGRDSNQQPTSSSTEMCTVTALPQACKTATHVVPVSAVSAHQWHAPDPISAANLSTLVSTPSNSSESVPQIGQGLGPRQSSPSLPPIRHEGGAQWQQQHQSQLQQPHSPVPQPQQHQQPLPSPHSQQQAKPLQAGQGNSYGRSSDRRLE